MGTTDANSSWVQIQQGVKDVERLIGQKQYNMAMIKSRQTLEFMTRCLGEKALIVESDLVDTIDQLCEGNWISKSTAEHYHRIRIIGNKAVHEGNESAYDANQAYHILSQEVHIFANEYSNKRVRPQKSAAAPARSRGRKRTKQSNFNFNDLIKPLAILAIIILLVAVIKLLIPDKDKAKETTAPITTEQTSESATTETPDTETPTTEASFKYTIEGTNVRIRSSASTSEDNILGTLSTGTQVDFIRDAGDGWSVIRYNNHEAYIASQFLKQQE